jgi:hypothetical protein
MQCHEFEDRMNDVLDQRLAPERDGFLVRHAGECSACRRLLDGQAALFSGLELCETPPLSGRFASAVLVQAEVIPVATLADGITRRNWKKKGIVAAIASLAVVALVVVVIGLSRQKEPNNPVAKAPVPPTLPNVVDVAKVPTAKAAPSPVIAKAISEVRPAPSSLAKQEYQEYREMLNNFGAQLPIAVEKIDEVQQATPAIRPLRASFSMAIGTLQRTIPNRTKRDHRPAKNDSGFYASQLDVVV